MNPVLNAEEWGVVIDALIEHHASSTARKTRNPDSTSNLRAEMCLDLIRRINNPPQPTPDDRPRGWSLHERGCDRGEWYGRGGGVGTDTPACSCRRTAAS